MARSFACRPSEGLQRTPVYWSSSPEGVPDAHLPAPLHAPSMIDQVLTKYAAPSSIVKAESEAVGRERDAVMGDDRKLIVRAPASTRSVRSQCPDRGGRGFDDSVCSPSPSAASAWTGRRRAHQPPELAYGWRSDGRPAQPRSVPEVKKESRLT